MLQTTGVITTTNADSLRGIREEWGCFKRNKTTGEIIEEEASESGTRCLDLRYPDRLSKRGCVNWTRDR
jgi:hypothetical protein